MATIMIKIRNVMTMFSMFSSFTRAQEWEAPNFALWQNLATRHLPCKQGDDDDDDDNDDNED